MKRDTKIVVTAIAANALVMLAKFAAAIVGGSTSLLAEGLHSLSETSDGVMHLVGERRSKRPPDDRHPFGHGKELYFWTLVVALSIFAIGGCVSILKGVDRIMSGKPIEHVGLTLGVLATAAIVQGASVAYAWFHFLRSQRSRHANAPATAAPARPIKKETTKFVVVFEDTAGVVGVIVALIATLLAHALRRPWIDGAGAIVIGVLLGVVGVRLAIEVRKLLVGERVMIEDLASLQRILNAERAIVSVGRLRTIHFGPETVVLAANVHFDRTLSADDVAHASHRVVRTMQAAHPEVKYIYLHPILTTGRDDAFH